MKLSLPPDATPAFVEFSNSGELAGSIDQMPRDDILQYIKEMCVTLSYMSDAKQCQRLTNLLQAAAVEAESIVISCQNPGVVHDRVVLDDGPTPYSVARKTQ